MDLRLSDETLEYQRHCHRFAEEVIRPAADSVATEIEAAPLLVWRAAWMGRNGIPMTAGQGSMSKLKAVDVTMWATTALMDLVGPEASLTEHPLEKWFRDAKIYQLFEGTAQVQRLVISRMQAAEHRRLREEDAATAQPETLNILGDAVTAFENAAA